jgi:hypothetical protein
MAGEELLPSALTNTTSVLQFSQAYAQALPGLIMRGDVGSIIMAIILSYVALIIVHQISFHLLRVFKFAGVLAIVGLTFYTVVTEFLGRFKGQADPMFMLIAVIGIAIGFVGVIVTVKGLLGQARRREPERHAHPAPRPVVHAKPASPLQVVANAAMPEEARLFQEKFVTMIIYILVAEFGVFSSLSTNAPTPQVGMILLGVFTAGVGLFVYKAFEDRREGFLMLGTAYVFAFLVALALGFFWNNMGLVELFSDKFFTSDSLVGLITGVALSMFMVKEKEK